MPNTPDSDLGYFELGIEKEGKFSRTHIHFMLISLVISAIILALF
jgi:hypothetical protein